MSVFERLATDMFLPVSQAVAVGNGLVGSGMLFRVIPAFIPDSLGSSNNHYETYLSQLPGKDYLLFVGALAQIKGVNVLLRAYSNIKNAPPLILIGYETSDFSIQTTEKVIVLKQWPHEAVMEAWRRSTIALIPSIWPDPCPAVAIEAMALGRPVIASKIGGLLDLVDDGKTGILVPPGDF